MPASNRLISAQLYIGKRLLEKRVACDDSDRCRKNYGICFL
jgi:hypothetical protein